MTHDEDPTRTEWLLRSFQGGVEQSFAQLYERLTPALYAWAVLRAPRGVDPSDVLGDVWLGAVRGLKRYDPHVATFRAWLFGIAKKVLLHALRDLDRREALGRGNERATSAESLERVPESVTSLSRRCERDEAMLRFLERVNALGSEERDLLVYCGLEGHSCEEAAERLGLTSDAATKRWQRLRGELRASAWAENLLA